MWQVIFLAIGMTVTVTFAGSILAFMNGLTLWIRWYGRKKTVSFENKSFYYFKFDEKTGFSTRTTYRKCYLNDLNILIIIFIKNKYIIILFNLFILISFSRLAFENGQKNFDQSAPTDVSHHESPRPHTFLPHS